VALRVLEHGFSTLNRCSKKTSDIGPNRQPLLTGKSIVVDGGAYFTDLDFGSSGKAERIKSMSIVFA
jgi:hypothetical protein